MSRDPWPLSHLLSCLENYPLSAPISGSGGDAQRLQGGVELAVEAVPEGLRSMALLGQDGLRRAGGRLVAGALGHAPQLLVGADLQVLEGVGEPGEFRGRV